MIFGTGFWSLDFGDPWLYVAFSGIGLTIFGMVYLFPKFNEQQKEMSG